MNGVVISLAIKAASFLQNLSAVGVLTSGRTVISTYFKNMGLSPKEINIYYDETLKEMSSRSNIDAVGTNTVDNFRNLLFTEINKLLGYDEKIMLLLLVHDCLSELSDDDSFNESMALVYSGIGIERELLDRFHNFIKVNEISAYSYEDCLVLSPPSELKDDELEGSWIESNAPDKRHSLRQIETHQLKSHLIVIYLKQIKAFVLRCLNNSIQITGDENNLVCRFKILRPGSELSLDDGTIMSYSQIKSRYLQLHPKGLLTLVAENVEYKSPAKTKEVHRFSTIETSGNLIGIVGKEGVGKTTLLKLLAGEFKPDSGRIAINGYNLWRNKFLLKGIIGYVPEDDLLIDELSVYDNLSLTARLHFSNLSQQNIEEKVDNVLKRLDVFELKNEIVGHIFSKHIQPGQRRLLNIALELLREPQILLVDNAIYGLGLSDATKVIKILHEYTFDGNLVITTISQSGSLTFSHFDKIWMIDEGGRIIYNGTVKDATLYLCKHLKQVPRNLQHTDPSQLLDLLNFKQPNGDVGSWKRVLQPKEWHELYYSECDLSHIKPPPTPLLPARMLKIPNLEVQLLIFSIRNFKSKFTRTRDILFSLLSGPVIAGVIGLILRFSSADSYEYAANVNIPIYIFISVIAAFFMGIILSANEFLKERNLLKKEEYLEFSRFSYVNSKILYLFPVIAFQLLLFTITGNLILQIKGMLIFYWIVLISVGCFGIMTGLFFSMTARNYSVMYEKLIPIAITLQVLFGGGIIPYNNMNLNNGKYVPVIGDLMVSRWGFEALIVTQFKDNEYEKLFYPLEKELSQAEFYSNRVVPLLGQFLDKSLEFGNESDSAVYYIELLENELSRVAEMQEVFPFEYLNELSSVFDNDVILEETRGYLTYLAFHYNNRYNNLLARKVSLDQHLNDSIGSDELSMLKSAYHNSMLDQLMRNEDAIPDYLIYKGEIVRYTEPVFQDATSNNGRAHLFSPNKQINGQYVDTLWFNITIIWMFAFLFYLLLIFNVSGFVRNILPGAIP